MIKLLQFLQEDCPLDIKEQIILLMRREWPQAFENAVEDVLWPDNPETHPTSLILIENNVVLSHVAVPWKYIDHEGQTFKAFGLSEVMTNPSYRNQGFGSKLVREAVSLIESQTADIGIFTCDPPLVGFYAKNGWEQLKNAYLVGGTHNQPFRSDSLGKCTLARFFSNKAQKYRHHFENSDIYLELGEGQLW